MTTLPYWGQPMYSYAPMGVVPQAYMGGGLAPQGFLGGALGGLLGGALGNTVGGWFGGADIGQTIGSTLGGIGGGLLPFAAGPTLAMAGAEPVANGGAGAAKPVLIPQTSVDPNVRATLNVIKAATNGIVDQLVRYVTDNQANQALLEIIPLVQRAAEFAKGGDYNRAYQQAYLAYQAIEIARANQTGLPALGG